MSYIGIAGEDLKKGDYLTVDPETGLCVTTKEENHYWWIKSKNGTFVKLGRYFKRELKDIRLKVGLDIGGPTLCLSKEEAETLCGIDEKAVKVKLVETK